MRNNEKKRDDKFREGVKRKKGKNKENKNNVFKQGRDAFRVELKGFTSLAQHGR